ncbi:hypothetical protein OsJ_29939 [Oryza sativa Japonica Group]|uniref:Uncharacterized protein n=1 Tax=Oryza sativa subsp. japonica TaxID=39947 RepID=A3C0F6_ORYSJ|nr:hypothetical protein OsJ_29939 [Oryza sativa Japonica Group]
MGKRRHIRGRDGSIDSAAKRKGSLCQQVANSEGNKKTRYSGLDLPEEIWCHIHSLMAFKDAARATCVSRAFHRSWQCHPNLIFCIGILGSDFINKFDRIVKNHSGIGIKSMKTLSLQYYCNAVYYARVESIPNVPNLETLTICSYHEIPKDSMEDDSIFGDSSNMRQMQEYRHDNLQSVVITCFCSAKSLIELTCCILDCTTSLEYLTLDTTRGVYSCSTGKHSQCFPMDKAMIPKANRAMLAIET